MDPPSNANPPAKPREPNSKNLSQRLRPVLENIQYASAGTFSIFLVLHLAAPIAAAFGGESAASQTMVLTRDLWYQRSDIPLEAIAVYGAGGVHVLAGAIQASDYPGSETTAMARLDGLYTRARR